MSKKINAEMMKIDRRIISRKLLTNEMSEKEISALLKKLPDVSDKAEKIAFEMNENSHVD